MRTARPLYKYLQASRLRSKRAFLDNLFFLKKIIFRAYRIFHKLFHL